MRSEEPGVPEPGSWEQIRLGRFKKENEPPKVENAQVKAKWNQVVDFCDRAAGRNRINVPGTKFPGQGGRK
ncbi:MAG: hypothetical protein LBP72_07525 [Dysgonamonadaceae bacterium]|nr:hypothetical protein [Dysgonamonadaceae bacterium]